MAIKNILITSSINSYPTLSYGQKTYISSDDYSSYPIEHINAGDGGTLPDFKGELSTNNLFVNVTQSWSGSVDSISGKVVFINNNEKEFIDGEYSGSNIQVSSQRLICNECESLLNASTSSLEYSIYLYSTPLITLPISNGDVGVQWVDNFLHQNTTPDDGEIYLLNIYEQISIFPSPSYSRSVKFIKINKIDSNGNDNSSYLSGIDKLRIIFTDIGIKEFEINSISEYPNYYLYSVHPSTSFPISTDDNNILDYRLDASRGLMKVLSNTITPVETYSVSYDMQNAFNSSSGIYTSPNTPNISLIHTASFIGLVTGSTGTAVFYIKDLSNGSTIISESFSTSNTPVYYEYTSSVPMLEGNEYKAYFYAIGHELTVDRFNWDITQSVDPQGVYINQILPEPFILGNFEYSECNSLINNAVEPEFDSNFFKVNYDSGVLVPTNQQQIISGLAEPAPINPSNYTSRAQILPRYIGVRNSSDGINLSSNSNVIGITNSENINLGIPSNQPAVENVNTYFAYFDWLGGTTPELTDKCAGHILYLINEDGDVLVPNISSSYYYNLIDNFITGENVDIVLNGENGTTSNLGTKSILRSGAIPWGIIASQTGSELNIQNNMYFGSSNSSVPNYYSVFSIKDEGSGYQVINPASEEIISFTNPPIINNNTSLSDLNSPLLIDDVIEITNTSNLTQLAIQLNLFISTNISGINPPYNSFSITLSILKESGGNTSVIYTNQFPLTYGIANQINISSPLNQTISGDKYYVKIFNPSGYYNVRIKNNGTSQISKLTVTQTPAAIVSSASYGVSSKYWVTGSSSKNILTGSQFGQLYNPTTPLIQLNYSSSGYFDFLPFELKIGDEIRFEGDELQTYVIHDVYNDTINQTLYLTLDKNIIDGTEINSFLIRRYHPHPNFITLDWDLYGYGGGNGFIIPQYVNKNIKNNFDKIVFSLKEKGII